jgi:putative membrane protein
MGLFSFVVNALLFWFVATFIEGFAVAGFIPALIGSALLTVVSWALHRVV